MGGLGGCDDLGHHWVVTTLGTCPYDNIDDDDDVDCLCFSFFHLILNGKIKPTTGLETLPPIQRKAF